MNKFVLVVEFDVKPESLQKFNELIAVNAKASVREEPGCRQFDVLQDLDNPSHVVLYNKQTAYKLKRTVAPPTKA